ncbi:hypothetical protein EFP44_01680 [Lacticaseibacillus paracasei]|nr:hypothetical protein [Lacticaseibacillus paracasei]
MHHDDCTSLSGVAFFLKTRSLAQKPAHKDLKPKWSKPNHLGFRPLMLRFLTAPAHAPQKKRLFVK